ncbi:phosphoribosyl-AMP cyclohydrolase [Klugiella xanthotipulae]|uniref:Phosphoribosyl-AMP cyclohydrolase n=1 Tax=Klugiella xanthotipulae TaxID=244735 RepID=A0A543HSK0_9MICO|nr:phosphoribosyl-AMP cyclohydrolase [Klugiella xanthotipulae]TQM61311.1 phosphoribosyl-AMP cyclohydrolase [Klugiella xanthotipulae]
MSNDAASSKPEGLSNLRDQVIFNSDGLIPAIVQQWDSGEVLMMAWMNAEALDRTLTEGRVTFWSRSRSELWRKGDTSGHHQYVHDVATDCDGDTLLVRVEQVGAACHTGTRTCFTGRSLGAVPGHHDWTEKKEHS